MDFVVSSDQLTFLQPIDSYIKPLGLTRMNFFSIVLGMILVLIYFLFSKHIRAWKESVKASLRKQIQGFTVQTHLSEDGKTLETSENPSITARVFSMIDSIFLAPDNEQEGFQEDSEDEEEGFEDGEEDDEEDGEEDGEDEEEESIENDKDM